MAENDNLEAFRIDPTMMGGVGGPPGGAAPASEGAAGEGGAGGDDAGYPVIEAICSKRKNVEAFREQVQGSVQRLQDVAGNGTDEQQALAQKALAAYGHMNTMLGRAVALTIENIKKAKAAAGK
jgi:hypothetical protein